MCHCYEWICAYVFVCDVWVAIDSVVDINYYLVYQNTPEMSFHKCKVEFGLVWIVNLDKIQLITVFIGSFSIFVSKSFSEPFSLRHYRPSFFLLSINSPVHQLSSSTIEITKTAAATNVLLGIVVAVFVILLFI